MPTVISDASVLIGLGAAGQIELLREFYSEVLARDSHCVMVEMGHPSSVLDRMLDPLARCFTPEVARLIAELRADSNTQHRVGFAMKSAACQ